MLGNVAHPRISMKQERICSSNGKDGPGRAMQREIYDDWNIRVGKQVEGRNFGWLTLISLHVWGPGKLDSDLRIMMTDINECFYVFYIMER